MEPEHGVPGGEKAYRATVTLTAAFGYTFAGVGANAFTYTGGAVTNSAASNVVTIVFPVTGSGSVVTDLDLTGKVGAPVTGGQPGGIFSTSRYMGSVEWNVTGSTASHTGAFQAGTAYTATVTLNAFTYTGASSVTNAAGTGAQIVVTIGFSAAGNGTPGVDVDLTGKFPTPKTGDMPLSGSFETGAAGYTGSVAWWTSGGVVPPSRLRGLRGRTCA